MAQINIAHFTNITEIESHDFTLHARDIIAKEIYGLEGSEIKPDSVSILVIPVDKPASLSGAETEIQVLVSGNDWPSHEKGQPANPSEAKVHFDKMAKRIYEGISKRSNRRIYVWVTPFTASGWAP